MAEPSGSDPQLEIGHVLFMDIVGYSKLLLDEQRELQEQLTHIVKSAPQVQAAEAGGKLIRLPTGDGMALVFLTVRKRRFVVQWRLEARSRVIPKSNCAWAFTAARLTRCAM